MRINATIALIGLMSVTIWFLFFVGTARSVSADFHHPSDVQILRGTAALSENLTECGPFSGICTSPNPDDRRRGLGYWFFYGVWMAIRWVALLVWGFWQWALAVVGGMVILFIGPRLFPKIIGFSGKSRRRSTSSFSMPFSNDSAEPPQQSERGSLEGRVPYQRDDMEQERKRQLQEFRRQQEERQRDWERRREQLRAEQAASARPIAEETDGGMTAPPSDDGNAPMSAEPDPPMLGTTTGGRSRRGFLAPLIISFLTLTIVGGIGALVAYVVIDAPGKVPASEAVAPTPDIEATVAAAVAMIPTLLTPSSPVQPEQDNPANATPTAAVASTAPQLPIPHGVGPGPTTPAPGRLPTIECPGCTVPNQPTDSYVEWIREPKVSENGILAFRARIDERAHFVVAGADCGFENLTLTDDNDGFYGAIVPRSMVNSCAARPGDWIADQYQYMNNLLTVRLQIDPVAALHPGLTLCLWSGRAAEELLACAPIKQP